MADPKMTDAEREALERKRQRLQSLLPLISTDKAVDVRYEIALIDQKLGPTKLAFTKYQPDLEASAKGVNGVGGLVFQAEAPPGPGRLVRVPFYLYDANFTQLSFQAPQVGPMVITGAGGNQVDETNPTVIVTMPNDPSGRRVLSGFLFRTPVIEWAKLRVVGLEITQTRTVYGGNAPLFTAGSPGPVPSALANVNFYDVGIAPTVSDRTGRYDSFAGVLPAPLPPYPLNINGIGGPPPGGFATIPDNAPIWGAGSVGGFPFAPRSISFGYVEVNTSSLTIGVVFKDNTVFPPGTQRNLVFISIGDPSITVDAVVGVTSVIPGGTRTVNFTFTPTTTGLVSTTVQLWWQSSANPPVITTVPIVGYGAPNNYYKNGQLYLLIRGLAVGGGANLLSQDGFIDATPYDAKATDFPGLRAYPELASPDQAFIEAAVVGPPLASMTFTINLVCDIMSDRDFGDPTIGPYDREAAMDRLEVSTPNTVVR
jgi:hypothetical protein